MMPHYKSVSLNEKIHLAVWQIQESEQDLLNGLFLGDKDKHLLQDITHRTKRIEFLAGRKLIYTTLEALGYGDQVVFRNNFGKPELLSGACEISLSHTDQYVVALLGKNTNVGIDIEKPQIKMAKIANRLFQKDEIDLCGQDLSKFCKVWSAKEVLFKLYMKGGIDFKQDLFIESTDELASATGIIRKNGSAIKYKLEFISLGTYFICYNIN